MLTSIDDNQTLVALNECTLILDTLLHLSTPSLTPPLSSVFTGRLLIVNQSTNDSIQPQLL